MVGYQATPTNFYEDYIEHYGVKGMKWRHRKSKKKKTDLRSTSKTSTSRANLYKSNEIYREQAFNEQGKSQAKTNEQQMAMLAAYQNSHSKLNNLGYESKNIGGKHYWEEKKKKK